MECSQFAFCVTSSRSRSVWCLGVGDLSLIEGETVVFDEFKEKRECRREADLVLLEMDPAVPAFKGGMFSDGMLRR